MDVELKIEGLGQMGQGIAHDPEGNIYFIEGVLPGDRVLARPRTTEKRFRDADLIELLEKSPSRQQAPCAVFDECGGCDWLDFDYSAQVAAKEEILKRVLERSGWLPDTVLPTVRAPSTLGYRNRIQLHAGGGKLGFYKKRSHSIVDIETCPVADPKLNEALAELRSQPENLQEGHKIELVVQPNGDVMRLDDQPHAAAGFGQVNDAQNKVLQERVGEWVKAGGARSVLELYVGNGNLTFSYLDAVEEVFAVDNSLPALEQAREKKKIYQDKQIAFMEDRVDSRLARRLPREFRQRYDTLLLDPPRAGAEGVLKPLIHDGLKNIIYVSCSPVPFTKDVQCLKEQFRFVQLQMVDMFPNTRHIEFVAHFSRLLS